MGLRKRIAAGALCLCLIVPAAFAEEAAETTDTVTSATVQQEAPGRGGRQPMPEQSTRQPSQSNQVPGQDGQYRQKPGNDAQQTPNGQSPEQGIQIPEPDDQPPEQSIQVPELPEQNGQRMQRKGSGKSDKGSRQKQAAGEQIAVPQDSGNPPALPQVSEEKEQAPVMNLETVSNMIRTLENQISELKAVLEVMSGSPAAE